MVTKHKLFLAWNMKKEQSWLEEQARNGLILKLVGFMSYEFEEGEPQDLVFQFDFQVLNKKNEQEYLDLFQDWHLVNRVGSWYYFYKLRSNDKTDVIYNDNQSKKEMYTRLAVILAVVALPLYSNLILIFPNLEEEAFAYPNFYFFFRIIVIILIALHMYALLKILYIRAFYNKSIKE